MRVLDLSHWDIHDISYEELQNQFEKDIHRIRALEKALDKACEYLEYRDMWLCHYLSQERYITKEEWKDELLKEVKE